MFNKGLEKQIKNIDEKTGRSFDEVSKRLSKIEEQLKPEPAFEKGDLVNFFLIDQELTGEIVGKYINFWEGLRKELSFDEWNIRYLDDNNVVQQVAVKEEDIWTIESNEITDLYDEIYELKSRIKELENKKK